MLDEYLRANFRIIPIFGIKNGSCTCGQQNCASPGKHPAVRDWPKHQGLSRKVAEAWVQKGENLGVLTGEASGIIAVDVDGRKGFSYLKALAPVPENVVIFKTSKGYHLLFNYRKNKLKNHVAVAPQVDIRTDRGYIVVPPSTHLSGKKYTIVRMPAQPLADIPPEWLFAFTELTPARMSALVGSLKDDVRKHAEALLRGEVSIPQGTVDATLTTIAGAIARRWPQADPAVLAVPFLSGLNTLYEMDTKEGRKPYPDGDFANKIARFQKTQEVEHIRKKAEKEAQTVPLIGRYAGCLVKTVNDEVIPYSCENNIRKILKKVCGDALRWDARGAKAVWYRPPPWVQPGASWSPQPVEDRHGGDCVEYFADMDHMRTSGPLCLRVLLEIAEDHKYDPVVEYLQSLTWHDSDGSNIDTWLVDYCRVQDTTLARAYGAKWLLSAVARAVDPGCQADCALILEGDQGFGKTSTFKALGHPWVTDSPIDMKTKAGPEVLQGRWIVELSELASVRAVGDIERVKSFISERVDVYRPAYGKIAVEKPRRCVFCGTTNAHEYLNDTTGNRRYWPVRCRGRYEAERIEEVRDKLWAEAYFRYQCNEKAYLDTESLQKAQAEDVALRMETDPWADVIEGWLNGDNVGLMEPGGGYTPPKQRPYVTGGEVLSEALRMPPERQTLAASRRVGIIMRQLGWTHSTATHRRLRVWRPPGKDNADK